MSGFSIRLTHRIMAIGAVGLVGLLAVGAIYEAGSRSQESSRSTAEAARNISTLNSKVATEMLEARRAEKDFQLRRDQAYTKRHAEFGLWLCMRSSNVIFSAQLAAFFQLS